MPLVAYVEPLSSELKITSAPLPGPSFDPCLELRSPNARHIVPDSDVNETATVTALSDAVNQRDRFFGKR